MVDFLLDGLVESPCNPSNSQESSPTTQFKNISSSVLSLLDGPTLTSIYDYWKYHLPVGKGKDSSKYSLIRPLFFYSFLKGTSFIKNFIFGCAASSLLCMSFL